MTTQALLDEARKQGYRSVIGRSHGLIENAYVSSVLNGQELQTYVNADAGLGVERGALGTRQDALGAKQRSSGDTFEFGCSAEDVGEFSSIIFQILYL